MQIHQMQLHSKSYTEVNITSSGDEQNNAELATGLFDNYSFNRPFFNAMFSSGGKPYPH